MKVDFLKKTIITALFPCVILTSQSFGLQAKTRNCPSQIKVSATEISLKTKSDNSVKEIAKPYLGVYECERLYFGGEDKKEHFEYLRVELKTKNELLVSYKLKNGETGKVPLYYEYDFEEKTLRVTGQWLLLKVDKKFPLEKGEITVALNLLGKLVNGKFSRK